MNQITLCTSTKTVPENYQLVDVHNIDNLIQEGSYTTAYEVIMKDHKQIHPYFDLDLKVDQNTKDPQHYLDNALEFLNQHFKNADWAISESNRPTKISYHLVATNYTTNVDSLKQFSTLPEFKQVHLDAMVYRTDNSKFRMIGTVGEKEDSVTKTSVNHEESIISHLVTWLDEDLVYNDFEMKKPEKKQPLIPPSRIVERLEEFSNIIDANKIEYHDWVKIGLYLKSVDRKDLFHLLSSKSQYYDPDGLEKKWNNFNPNGSINLGTIEHYARTTNPEKYLELTRPTGKHFDSEYFKQLKTMDEKIRYFNEYNFWYSNGNCLFELSDLYKTGFKVRSRKEFNDNIADIKMMNLDDDEDTSKKKLVPFSKVWFESTKRRVVYNVHFTPYFGEDQSKNDSNSWNMFPGFIHQYDQNFVVDQDKIKQVIELIDILVDHDQLCFKYMINFLAQLIQDPSNKIPVAIVLVSLYQGVGKNAFIDFFGNKVVGSQFYHYTNNWAEFTDKFNGNMETCLFECMDELASSGAQFKEYNMLKSIISQTTRKIEYKGKDKIHVSDYTRHIFCSNNSQHIVRIEAGDRRWLICNADNSLANNSEFFDRFFKNAYNLEVGKHFYHYLANIDLTGWDWRKIPMTYLKQSLMEKSFQQYLVYLIVYYAKTTSNIESGIEQKYQPLQRLTDIFKDFKEMFPKNQMNSKSFSYSLYNLNSDFKSSTKKHGGYTCINMNLDMIKQSVEQFTKITPFPFDDYVDYQSTGVDYIVSKCEV